MVNNLLEVPAVSFFRVDMLATCAATECYNPKDTLIFHRWIISNLSHATCAELFVA
jgi:hypothetical protein